MQLTLEGSRWLASGELCRETCAAFRELLLRAVEAGDGVSVLDLSGVERIDMHGAQLLASFLGASSEHRIEQPSEPVREFLQRVGAYARLVHAP
ncbi:MAG: STAS domain-containing protein [Polyangiaceae bacterium]